MCGTPHRSRTTRTGAESEGTSMDPEIWAVRPAGGGGARREQAGPAGARLMSSVNPGVSRTASHDVDGSVAARVNDRADWAGEDHAARERELHMEAGVDTSQLEETPAQRAAGQTGGREVGKERAAAHEDLSS